MTRRTPSNWYTLIIDHTSKCLALNFHDMRKKRHWSSRQIQLGSLTDWLATFTSCVGFYAWIRMYGWQMSFCSTKKCLFSEKSALTTNFNRIFCDKYLYGCHKCPSYHVTKTDFTWLLNNYHSNYIRIRLSHASIKLKITMQKIYIISFNPLVMN